MKLWSKVIDGKEVGIEIIEERSGVREDDQGFMQPTHNCYAGIGYELNDDNKRTGRIIAWAGNNATGEVDVVESESLDAYLHDWDDEWPDDFRREHIL